MDSPRLAAEASGLSQVPRAGIPPVNLNLHVPRDGTAMVQTHLESALQDEQSRWHWKAVWRRMLLRSHDSFNTA